MILYVKGAINFPSEMLPLAIDGVSSREFRYREEQEFHRETGCRALAKSSHVIVEISSLNGVYIMNSDLVANLTSLSNFRKNQASSSFINTPTVYAASERCIVKRYSKQDFLADILRILALLGHRRVTLVSHFRACNLRACKPAIGTSADDRVLLGLWVAEAAALGGCLFVDQSDPVSRLGPNVASKDSSRYSGTGEREMASLIEATLHRSKPQDVRKWKSAA